MNKLKIAGLAVAVLVGVPLAMNAVGTFNSAATAPGRVAQRTLTTDNILSTYEGFFNVKAEYDARLPQITERAGYLADEKDPAEKQRLRMELSAARQSCRELAQRYNADASKNNDSLFLDNDLPRQLDAAACEKDS